MKTKYAVFDQSETNHEYDITIKKKKNGKIVYSLYYSHNSSWVYPGKLRIRIIDSGNGLKFIGLNEDENSEIDYGTVSELQLLLNFISAIEYKIRQVMYINGYDEMFKVVRS